ncbi:adenylate/guanylate cyclase domain-containing protein [uncultured Kocuria sp.]|uniref:adenylate/guanylate cyclase domain-containing protein n=1 Tax=uncultured Kocuria sp. TaxID=259305 RepID=UPI00260A2201|nr:adenylate/guanylate cyclase domain-containing protein [uncultured Kocuria sp.]
MTLHDELEEAVDKIALTKLNVRYGRSVPDVQDFNLSNEGIKLDAAYMYVDLVGSTRLEADHEEETVARSLKAFLTTVTKVILHYKGEIRSFDGDRVMAIFIGDDKCARAVRAAWAIRWAIENIAQYTLWATIDELFNSKWKMQAGIGIDTGFAMLIRGGVRDNNDIVSIGYAPNIAAKLSDIRTKNATYITEDVWEELPFELKYKELANDNYEAKWSTARYQDLGGRTAQIRFSTYWLILK